MHVPMYLYANLLISVFYLSAYINIVFGDSCLCKLTGLSANLGQRDAIRNKSHVTVRRVVVTDQAGNLLLQVS